VQAAACARAQRSRRERGRTRSDGTVGAHRAGKRGIGEQRLQLGAERDDAAALAVVQRLLPEPVAHDPEPAPWCIPQGEREHADEMFDALESPLIVRREDHLGVGLGAEGVPETLELFPKLEEVVHLAVEGDDKASAVPGHGIAAERRQVHD
jgi:hypothetical protein